MSEEPSLKCVIAWSDKRNLCTLVAAALETRLGSESVRRLGDESLTVHATASTADIRDLIASVLDSNSESAFVVEFETWSSAGPGIDITWLTERGH